MRVSAIIGLGVLICAGAAAALVPGDRAGRLLLSLDLPGLAAPLIADPALAGAALYRAGRFEDAALMLKRSLSPEAAYNLGNALAMAGDLKGAVTAYDIALKRDPDDSDARENRALVLALLKPPASDKDGEVEGTANSTANREHDGSETEKAEQDAANDNGATDDGMAGDREAGSDAARAGSSKVDRRGDARQSAAEDGAASSKGAATDAAGEAGKGGGQTTAARSDGTTPPPPPATAKAEGLQATRQWLAAIPDDPVRFLRLRIAAEHQKRLAAGTAVVTEGTGW